MLPKQGLDVELMDSFIKSNSNFAHLSGKKLNILKLDIKVLYSASRVDYEVYFSDGSYIFHITVDQDGQWCGQDVFKSWVTKGAAQKGSFDPQVSIQSKGPEPKNNDGRTSCYWCGAKTKNVPSAFSSYDICTNPSCQR